MKITGIPFCRYRYWMIFGIHKGNTFKNNRKNEFGRQRIMKSVRTKLIASILICSLFTSVLIGVIAISNSVRTAGKDAMTMMQLTGQKKTEEINSTIQKIEQSVDTLSEVALRRPARGARAAGGRHRRRPAPSDSRRRRRRGCGPAGGRAPCGSVVPVHAP